MTHWRVAIASGGLLALLCAGCSAVPSDPRAVLEENASVIDSAAQDLLEALDAAGLKGTSATGSIGLCQGPPSPGVDYSAAITATVGNDPVGGFNALAEQLDATGWTATDAYADAGIDPSTPAQEYTRGPLVLSVKTGGFSVGGTRYGADAMNLGITLSDHCVRVPDSTDFTELHDLNGEIPPRD